MLKRGRITLVEAQAALVSYQQIVMTLVDIDLAETLELSARLNIYAYDAYVIACALRLNAPLLTLDGGLKVAARVAGVTNPMQTYLDTQRDLPALLEEATRLGGVRIRRQDGQTFLLTPDAPAGSPLDIPGIDLSLTSQEIVAAIREGRERG
jgi:hypothetical protein